MLSRRLLCVVWKRCPTNATLAAASCWRISQFTGQQSIVCLHDLCANCCATQPLRVWCILRKKCVCVYITSIHKIWYHIYIILYNIVYLATCDRCKGMVWARPKYVSNWYSHRLELRRCSKSLAGRVPRFWSAGIFGWLWPLLDP